MLNEGDLAPDFSLMIEDETTFVLSENKGKPVVVYFYPRDNTPGCTKEAIDFTQNLPEFEKLKTKIIGISPDSVKKHVNFINKHELGISLGADEDKGVAIEYGVWAEKKNYGRTYMGIVRTTFLIDKDGRIAKIWNKVKVKDHAAAVLEAIANL